MIRLQQIVSASEKIYLKKIKNIYENSFPPDERRSFDKVVGLLEDQRFLLAAILFDDEVVGMLSKWDFNTFVYIEHFAISATYRGNGLGSHTLQKMIQEETRQIILEVELPEDHFSLKRIKFYENFGFSICHEHYIQPPYEDGKKAVPMLIMVQHQLVSVHEFQNMKQTIHNQVYGFFG